MKALASDALASSSESFLKLAKSQLEQLQQKTTNDLEQRKQAVEHLVAPIKESLTKVDGKLQELEVARTHAYSTLSSQVQQLAETQKELRSETGNLVSALRDRPNVRGRWGEIQLRRVVEMAGMLEYCDFQTQQHVATDDGRLRPDLVVKMPGGGSVVVDAKVAGQAYIESLEAKDDASRLLKLRDHARQVRDHVVKLGAKNYWAQFERDARLRRALPAGRDVPERRARAGSGAARGQLRQPRPHRHADDAHRRSCARSPTAGGRRRSPSPPRRSATSAASSTSGSRRSPSTSRRSATASRARSRPTTRASARSSGASSPAPAG